MTQPFCKLARYPAIIARGTLGSQGSPTILQGMYRFLTKVLHGKSLRHSIAFHGVMPGQRCKPLRQGAS